MKAVTVCQPWAWAIVHGDKRIENRTWQTAYRGRLLIHAGLSRARIGHLAAIGRHEPPDDSLDFGAIIGVATLADCVPLAKVAGRPYADGPYCWMLTEVIPIAPVPCRGQMSLFSPPESVLAKVQSQLRRR